jgi:hypothetical protein
MSILSPSTTASIEQKLIVVAPRQMRMSTMKSVCIIVSHTQKYVE